MAFFKKSVEDKIATLVLDRPPVNALNKEVMVELGIVLDEVIKDDKIKVVILTGGGQKVFIAGADLKEMATISSSKEAEDLATKGQAVLTKLENMDKPVIAAINGVCLGGGMELIQACHIRISSDRARYAQPEISLGIMPGFGGTQRLSRIVGWSKATEIILTGDVITPQEAYRIGLVNAVVRDGALLKTAKEMAKKIAQKGAVALRASMRSLREGRKLSLDEALANEAKLFSSLVETEDFREGMKAFLEKRRPKFQDR